jgi:hypothetical protein
MLYKKGSEKPFHKYHDTIEEATECIARYADNENYTVYLAQSAYAEKRRIKENVRAIRSFWLDIDCGPNKPFPTQGHAFKALVEFVTKTGLPRPIVVNSGHGLYAHWPLTDEVPRQSWVQSAKLLKNVTSVYEFEADSSRTSDAASVLRPVGSVNRKVKCDGCNDTLEGVGYECPCGGVGVQTAKPVTLIPAAYDAPTSIGNFTTLLEKAAKRANLTFDKVTSAPKKSKDINSEFQIYDNVAPTADAEIIADKCQQMAIIRRTKGNVSEPFWYAAVGLLRYTMQSPDIIHEWSSGHPNYSAHETDAKIKQHEESGAGPSTCAYLNDCNEKGCAGCVYKDKIRSPIVLGRVLRELANMAGIEPPTPFARAEDGLYVKIEDVDIRFYSNDLYVDSVAYDESLPAEVVVIKHHLPQDGWLEFNMKTSALTDTRSAMVSLFDNHVTVVGQKEKKFMVSYIESYAEKLKRERKLNHLLCQMGWKNIHDETKFVLGKRMFNEDGTVTTVSMAHNIPQSAKAFHPQGELSEWIKATHFLSLPGMQPLAFAFLAGAFGAPLVKFTGYNGAMVSLLGPSGIGKTLVGELALSVYGKPNQLTMHMEDTKNALVGRLGIYGSLPLYIDEVTNLESMELSSLIYRITQGRDKVRQGRDAVEKASINQWNTLALVSTNSSIVDKLSGAKLDASAEVNRIFEITIERNQHLTREVGKQTHRAFSDNFGLAGQEYLRYLTMHTSEHRERLDKVIALIDKRTNAQAEERFWSTVAGVAIYGGSIAKSLGLIEFEIAPILEWVVDAIIEMRTGKADSHNDAVSILGQFLDEHAANALIVKDGRVVHEPRGALVYRIDVDTQALLIGRKKLNDWVNKRYGSYTSVKNELLESGALRSHNYRKVLGAGTSWSGTQQPCWMVDLQNPTLGVVNMVLSEKIRRLDKLHNLDDLDAQAVTH